MKLGAILSVDFIYMKVFCRSLMSEDVILIQKNERSLKEVLKEVLKEADYKKVVSIAEVIDVRGKITPAEAKLICRKSETTTWRYLSILVDTGYVISESSTNSVIYRKK